MTEPKPQCAGIIVFDNNKTVLVTSHKGHFSFPKGGRKKTETAIEAGWRELEEETGLTNAQVKLLDGVFFDEYSRKGKFSVRYFVGVLMEQFNNFTFDKDELAKVEWYEVTDALKFDKLAEKRREILKKAHNVFYEQKNI